MGAIVPQGYTRVREGIYAIAEIRYAGIEPHDAMQKVNAAGYQTRLTREQLEECADAFWSAVDNEAVGVYIEQMTSGEMLRVAPDLLEGIPCLRRYSVSSLSHLRPQHLLYFHLEQRFPHGPEQAWPDWVKRFQLLVENSELQRVGKKLRGKRKREKSRPASANPRGRPSLLEEVISTIRNIVESGNWAYPATIKELSNLVNRRHNGPRISDSTVTRGLDQLFQETSDNRYYRPKRARATFRVSPS